MATARPLVPRSRRWFLRAGGALGASIGALRNTAVSAAAIPDRLGAPVSGYGPRSRFERAMRAFGTPRTPEAASSLTPLASSYGIITPSSLHFERHHAGVPEIDPGTHTLTIHGLVDRPLVFTVDELKRFPSVSRIFFIECSGNSGSEWRGAGAADVQRSHGLTSCSEWTGVWLSTLLRECAVRPGASWILAEGADAARVARSMPLDKALRDVLVAYGQNGEALRPEQGYPLRLIVPGYEGNVHIKWVHRIKVIDRPAMTRWETSKYTDLMPDGRARIFTFEMDAKSVITAPSPGLTLPSRGTCEITGLAWSGRGAITGVDITVDGGQSWTPAELQSPVLPIAHTRFRWSWNWDGQEALIASRAVDQTGYVQPAIPDLVNARGLNSGYHQNGIQPWRVSATGAVSNGL
jgi:sulfane dehydrogenase subunit SoxC